jgi:probable phosphoglycerate mutase
MKLELIIVRHGETAWTITRQYTGVTELELTDHGRSEATAAGRIVERLLDGRPPTVLASPRQRAVQTAQLAIPDAVAATSPLIAEFDYGRYEGMTFDQVTAAQPGWEIWRDGCPGGETVLDVGARAEQFLVDHVAQATGPVIAVTHGHFSRVLAVVALGMEPHLGGILNSATGSVSLIEQHQGRRRLGLWNATARWDSG